MTLTIGGLEIPKTVDTLEGFRRWVGRLGDEAPRVHYSRGKVHIEMTPQSYDHHEPLADEINGVLRELAKALDLGKYYMPPSWVTCAAGDLSTEPDGFLAFWETLRSGALRVNPARRSELLGRPDMALEVVSKTTAKKDLEDLVRDYAGAGVAEYWIADARRSPLVFRILALRGDSYVDVRPDGDGFLASAVWGRSFRLVPFTNKAGLPDFRLEVRGRRARGRSKKT